MCGIYIFSYSFLQAQRKIGAHGIFGAREIHRSRASHTLMKGLFNFFYTIVGRKKFIEDTFLSFEGFSYST